MPKWTDYTIKANPADKDEVMTLDTAGKVNKRLGLSALSDWILNKLADKVFQKLETNSKTVLGAINELNSNQFRGRVFINVKSITNMIKENNFSSGEFCFFHLAGAAYSGNDLPSASSYKYGSGIVFYRNQNSCKIILFSESEKPVWKTSSWTNWKDFASDIVN